MMIWLPAGIILAFVFIFLARAFDQRKVFAIGLVVAAFIYVGFAVSGGASAGWIVVEVLGVALYGFAAWLGLRVSPWWLVIGWGAHPVWDVGLHLVGTGREFAPGWYAIICISFDTVVALYIAYRCARPGTSNFTRFRGGA